MGSALRLLCIIKYNVCLHDEAACMAVVASEKGVVVGRLAYREDGDLIDCRRMGVGGKAIPPNVDKVQIWCNPCCFGAIVLAVRASC